jgi:hypothetical protein
MRSLVLLLRCYRRHRLCNHSCAGVSVLARPYATGPRRPREASACKLETDEEGKDRADLRTGRLLRGRQEVIASGHKFKIGQLVHYSGRDRAPRAFFSR